MPWRSSKHSITIHLSQPVKWLYNNTSEIKEISELKIRNPYEYQFFEASGKCFVVVFNVTLEIKESLDKVTKLLKTFRPLFEEEFREWSSHASPDCINIYK